MSFKQEAAKLLHRALDGEIDFLELRGTDEFARESGDIDVLVPQGLADDALALVARLAQGSGWSIAAIGSIGYLTQVCLAKRCGNDAFHQAVKIDFFNGASWAAVGVDPLGSALFDWRDKYGEREAAGLTTLLQKLLYAGYLRERDRERILAACDAGRIARFMDATGLPLSRGDLDRGKLGHRARWRLRAASAGVTPTVLPAWIAKVVWRKLVFGVVRSTVAAPVIVVSGGDASRRAVLIDRYTSLLQQAGLAEPAIRIGRGPVGAWAAPTAPTAVWLAWHALRRDRVLVDAAALPSPDVLSRVPATARVQLANDAGTVEEDLGVLLADVSNEALTLLSASAAR